MIYRNNYFSKEWNQGFIVNDLSGKREFSFAIFLGLSSFAIHFVLQTLTESVLSDAFPEFMQPSYFSTLYTYINVAFIFQTFYFLIAYERLTFAEIRKNRWYLLIKTGYEPTAMILSKLVARLLSIVMIYSVGFIFTILLTVFLKYNFIYEYFLALYVTGLIDLILVVIIFLTASLFVKTLSNARYFIFFSAVAIIVFKVFSGYYNLSSNRVLMQNIYNLFDFTKSLYLPLAALTVMVCVVVIIFGARNFAKYYSLPNYISDEDLPAGAAVVQTNSKTGLPDIGSMTRADRNSKQGKVLNAITTSVAIVVILALLAFNTIVIIISASQPGKEVTIIGTIPYIFKTDTMEPDIMKNDLAYFERLDAQAPVSAGQIVLFKDMDVVYIERVIGMENESYIVDIDHYPPMSQQGAMRKVIARDAIYGAFTGRNRWLGALILFANTVTGRFVFLLVPAVLLFFYKVIFDAVRSKAKGRVAE